MNTHPEAVIARSDAQDEMLMAIEAMLDGDAEDCLYHVTQWRDRKDYAASFEVIANNSNEVHASVKEAEHLRFLLSECYERLVYREHCGGLPPDIERKVNGAIFNQNKQKLSQIT
jgi:hypothetical protein